MIAACRGGLRDEMWRERVVEEIGGERHDEEKIDRERERERAADLRLAPNWLASFFRSSLSRRASSVGRATLS